MIKRTVEVSREPAHLAVRDRQLLILRKTTPPEPLPARPPNLAGSIPVEDLGIIVVDEAGCTYSHSALCELAARGAVLVVCGRDHLPAGLLLPLVEHTEVLWRLDDQISATVPAKKRLWRQIVRAKIRAQARNLPADTNSQLAATKLRSMLPQVRSGDTLNHEAQAARIYWAHWLGGEGPGRVRTFKRDPSPNRASPPPNNFLNYGYAILRAAVARAIVGAGLLPALSLKHSNRSNALALADDLVEPLRPLVDRTARDLYLSGQRELTQPNKASLLLVLHETVRTGGRTGPTGPLLVALHRYAASLAACLAGDRPDLDIPVPVSDVESRGLAKHDPHDDDLLPPDLPDSQPDKDAPCT